MISMEIGDYDVWEICDYYDVCEFVYVQSGNWLKFSNLVLVGNTEACMKNE